MPPPTVFDQWNAEIAAFVNAPENRRLRPGTGYYSTLFRGGLFGLDRSIDVAQQLAARRVRVLWMGMNPRVPQSLGHVLAPTQGTETIRRLNCNARRATTPLGLGTRAFPSGTGTRSSGREAAGGSTGTSWSALPGLTKSRANFLPWGSDDVKAFLAGVGTLDRGLLNRALAFADSLNTTVVEALSPDLVVVPFSLGRNGTLNRVRTTELSLATARDIRSITVPGTAPRFTFHVAQWRRGRAEIRALYLRHPRALQYCTDARRRIADALGEALARELG